MRLRRGAVVGGEDHQRLLVDLQPLQLGQQVTQERIEVLDLRSINSVLTAVDVWLRRIQGIVHVQVGEVEKERLIPMFTHKP